MDFFADKHFKEILFQVCDNWHKPLKNEMVLTEYTLKQLFKTRPAAEVYEWISEILARASEEEWISGYPDELFEEQKESLVRINIITDKKRSKLSQAINEKLTITAVAAKFGCKFNKKGDKIVCPFHQDKEPSCSLSDDYNTFKCWGCGVSGNLIKFIAMMRKIQGVKN